MQKWTDFERQKPNQFNRGRASGCGKVEEVVWVNSPTQRCRTFLCHVISHLTWSDKKEAYKEMVVEKFWTSYSRNSTRPSPFVNFWWTWKWYNLRHHPSLYSKPGSPCFTTTTYIALDTPPRYFCLQFHQSTHDSRIRSIFPNRYSSDWKSRVLPPHQYPKLSKKLLIPIPRNSILMKTSRI